MFRPSKSYLVYSSSSISGTVCVASAWMACLPAQKPNVLWLLGRERESQADNVLMGTSFKPAEEGRQRYLGIVLFLTNVPAFY